MLAGLVQVSTGTKTSLGFQDGPVFTRVHRREGPAATRGSRARTHGTTIPQPTWPGVPDRLHPAYGAGAGPATFRDLRGPRGLCGDGAECESPRSRSLCAAPANVLGAHLERVREHLGLTAFDEKARQRLAPFVFKEAFRLEQGAALVSRCEEYLREQDILCPARPSLHSGFSHSLRKRSILIHLLVRCYHLQLWSHEKNLSN